MIAASNRRAPSQWGQTNTSISKYILGPFGTDCDLRRFGLAMAMRGNKAAKRSALVAVARKLAVLLHRLWVSGQDYDPLRQTHARDARRQRPA